MKAIGAKTALARVPVVPAGVEEQIRCRAYQIYEERGKIDGYELEDWLQAETEVMTRQVMRKAS
jgi:hypothetical protein